jgi:Ras-related protein Rab-1A
MNPEKEKDPIIILKILILGDSGVGKTSILIKYINNKFDESHIATIGVDYMDKTIKYKNINVKLQIWDTSGQEKFRSIARNFYRNSDAIFIVFDLNNKDTYNSIKQWINDVEEYCPNIKKILLGNKSDLEKNVSEEIIKNFAKENNLQYFETSAKNGTNIKEAFKAMVDLLLGGKSEQEILNGFALHESDLSIASENQTTKKKKCC